MFRELSWSTGRTLSFTAEGTGSYPGWGTNIHKPCGAAKKENTYIHIYTLVIFIYRVLCSRASVSRGLSPEWPQKSYPIMSCLFKTSTVFSHCSQDQCPRHPSTSHQARLPCLILLLPPWSFSPTYLLRLSCTCSPSAWLSLSSHLYLALIFHISAQMSA